MKLAMIGIDYKQASVEIREQFALTSSGVAELERSIIAQHGAAGCIVLSTCNRFEIWCSGFTAAELKQAYQAESRVEIFEIEDRFISRSGMDAVRYLFELGCGLHSQILGEDQILSQIKGAVKAARERGNLDSVLETLFRLAVTAGKKVKSSVRLTGKDLSVPAKAVEMAEQMLGSLSGKRCLVIGNGEMGRLACSLLVEKGADVLMTLRQYKKKDAVVPKGCKTIPYEERYRWISQTDLVFSATLSPHFTVETERLREVLKGRMLYCFDLAVPRDIDPDAGKLPGVLLFDLDHLGSNSSCNPDALQKALDLLVEYEEEFERWYYFREFIPVVVDLSREVSFLTSARLEKDYKALPSGQDLFREKTEEAFCKSFAKLLYGSRDHLDREHWKACLEAVIKTVEEWQEDER